MSDKDRITRREALTAVAGAGSVTLPGVASGRDGSGGVTDEQLEREVRRSLAASEHIVADPASYRQFTAGRLDPQTADGVLREDVLPDSTTADDVELYSGAYRTARPPSGTHVTVETRREWQRRDTPVAFDGVYRTPGRYLQTDPICVEPLDFEVCVSLGADLSVEPQPDGTVDVEFVLDLFIETPEGSTTITLVEVEFNLDPSEPQEFCLGPVTLDLGVLPDLEFEVCGTVQTGGEFPPEVLELSLSPKVCVDPCSIFDCETCESVGPFEFEIPL